MTIRKPAICLAITAAIAAPLAAVADGTWVTTHEEPVSHMMMHAYGTFEATPPLPATRSPQPGDLSRDRQYEFLGPENGWTMRPMQYGMHDGRFTHLDDPAGHMHHMADTSPLTASERLVKDSSSGN